MKNRHTRFGFTLIEELLYMGLLVVFLGVLMSIFVSLVDAQLESRATSALQQDGRFLLSRFTYDVKTADGISLPVGATPSAQLQLSKGSETVEYSVINGVLYYTDTTGSYRITGSGTTVSTLSFVNVSNIGGQETVTMNVTLVSVDRPLYGVESITLQTSAQQRK